MATTIGTVSPYKKGSPPDFGTLYSGRALSFDGVSDYVKIGRPVLGSSFTYTAWIKPDSVSVTGHIIGNYYGDGNETYLRQDSQTIQFQLYISSETPLTSSNVLKAGIWHHVVGVYDSGATHKIYVDGVEVASGTAPTGSISIDNDTAIGARYAGQGDYFNGNITNVQIWDKAWTLSDVQYAYTHPEKLVTDGQGGGVLGLASFNISNLKAWYPCTEGNPASPQTTVYDGSPKELGSELVGNGNFNTDDTGWVNNNGTVTVESGELKVVTSSTAFEGVRYPISITGGTLYKIVFTARLTSGSSPTIFFSNSNTSSNYSALLYPTFTSSNQTFTYYLLATSTQSTGHISWLNGSAASRTFYLDNVSVKEVKMGNHGTTTFYGNMSDLLNSNQKTFFADILDTTDDMFDFGGNNADAGTTLIDTGDDPDHGFAAVNALFTVSSGHGRLTNTSSSAGRVSMGFTTIVGNSYNVLFDVITGDNSNVKISLSTDTSYNTDADSGSKDTGTNYTLVNNFVATGTTSYIVIQNVSTTNLEYSFPMNIKIREVGVASGWTTADAEPLIPQTALMGMSKPLYFSGGASKAGDDKVVVSNHSSMDTSGSNITIAAWVLSDDDRTGEFVGILKRGWGYIRRENSNKYRWYFTPSGTNHQIDSTTVPSGGVPHFIVCTYDGTTQKMYINGSLESSATTASGTVGTGDDLTIGVYDTGGGSTQYWGGLINEISIWDEAFTLAKVQELFNDGVILDATLHSSYVADDDKLLSYYRNDGTSSWTDRSKNSNNGTVSGTRSTALLPEGTTSDKDILGFPLTHTNNGWLNLDNTGTQPLSISKSSVFEIGTGDCTLECWVKLDYTTVSVAWNIMQLSGSGRVYMNWRGDSGDYLQLNIQVASGGNQDYTPFTIVDSNWHHIVAVFDRSASTPKIYAYKDGGTLGGGTTASTNITVDSSVITISNEPQIGDSDFSGSIDEARIYKKALSAAEVLRNYKHGKGKH